MRRCSDVHCLRGSKHRGHTILSMCRGSQEGKKPEEEEGVPLTQILIYIYIYILYIYIYIYLYYIYIYNIYIYMHVERESAREREREIRERKREYRTAGRRPEEG